VLKSFTASKLTYISGFFFYQGSVTSLSLPSLGFIGGRFLITGGAITNISLPALKYVGGEIDACELNVLAKVDFIKSTNKAGQAYSCILGNDCTADAITCPS